MGLKILPYKNEKKKLILLFRLNRQGSSYNRDWKFGQYLCGEKEPNL